MTARVQAAMAGNAKGARGEGLQPARDGRRIRPRDLRLHHRRIDDLAGEACGGADAPRPDRDTPRGPRRALRRAALIRLDQIWPRRLCLRRLSIGKRATDGRGRGPAAGRSRLDGVASWSCQSVSGGPRRKRARRGPAAAASADWCWLPEDLLVAVMGELEVMDLVRVGAACSSWWAAFTTFRRLCLPSRKQPPFLLYSPLHDDPDVAVLGVPSSSSSSRALTIRAALPGLPLSRRTFVGSGYGWLVTTDEASNLHLVNPLTDSQVALPPLAALHNVESSTSEGGGLMYRVFMNREVDRELAATFTAAAARETMYQRAVLSCSPSAGAACVMLLIHWPDGELSFARLGDECWTLVSAVSHGPLQRYGCRDALYDSDSGLFYVLRLDGTIYTLDLNGESPLASRIFLPLPMGIFDPSHRGVITMYLVRAPSGDLLQVYRRIIIDIYPLHRLPPYTDDYEEYKLYCEIETYDVQVYMVDLHGQKLEQMTTLGDHSLFLGYNNSMCISTKDLLMLEPNLAYLTDDCYECVYTDTESSRDMGVFKIGETPKYKGMNRRLSLRCFPFPCIGSVSRSQFGSHLLFTRFMNYDTSQTQEDWRHDGPMWRAW